MHSASFVVGAACLLIACATTTGAAAAARLTPEQALASRRVTFNYKDTPLKEMAADLTKQSGIRVRVDSQTFEALAWEAGVTASVRDKPLGTALNVICHEGRWHSQDLTYYVDGDAVVVTYWDQPAATTTVRYDLRRALALGGGGGGPGAADRLVELITKSIDADRWGGEGRDQHKVPRVDEKAGTLEVAAQRSVHARVEWLLAALADPANPPVSPYSAADTPARRQAIKNLGKPLGKVGGGGKAVLKDLVQRVRQAAGVDVVVNWRGMYHSGQEAATPVAVPANATAGQALKAALDALSAEGVPLVYDVDADGLVVVTTDEFMAEHMLLNVYNAGTAARASRLVTRVKEQVAPDEWQESGGSGSMTAFGPLVVVSQSRAVHHQVATAMAKAADSEKEEAGKPSKTGRSR